MVLIEVHGADGGLVGRCDARCYNAKHPECDCVCHGANHGKGLGGALVHIVPEELKECSGDIVTQFPIQQDLFGGKKNE